MCRDRELTVVNESVDHALGLIELYEYFASGSKRQRHNCNQQHMPGQAAQKRKSVVGEREEGERGKKEKGEGTEETGNQKTRKKERRVEKGEEERKKTERKSEGKGGQRRRSKKIEEEEKGLKEREERKRGRSKESARQKWSKANESDEEKVDKDVMGEVEGMVKNSTNPWGFKQSDVRDELTDATNREIL